jgi:diguanylate cyclase (GGDEF)-like protein
VEVAVARVFGKSSAEAIERENQRLAALAQLDLLDSPRDEGFERIVRLIRTIFSIDIGLVSLIDAHRQWYSACSGLSASEVPRGGSFCRFVVDSEEPIVVSDASKDQRFAQHPAVTGEEHIRFYAGVPLRTRSGHTVGTVCAIDRRARSFNARDLSILEELSGAAMDRIELIHSASTDSLTEALTRRAFKQEADQLISLATRHQHDLSCIVLDIDHFKTINDTHGHATGDEVLKAVVAACRPVLRTGDVLGRLGGEEFAILLPHIDRDGAAATAERLRTVIASQQVQNGSGIVKVTASFGLSSLSIVTKDIDTLLAQADAAMYRAKTDGRNRCVSWASISGEDAMGARRRVLKAGSILFNDRRSTIDCTVRSLGADGASLSVSNSTGIPPEFALLLTGEGREMACRVIASDRQNLEVAFR